MKQALEALEEADIKCNFICYEAKIALRAAITEAERQEPVADDKLLFLQVFSICEALQMPPIEAIEQAIEFIEGVHQGEWSGKFSRYETLANLHALREDMKKHSKFEGGE